MSTFRLAAFLGAVAGAAAVVRLIPPHHVALAAVAVPFASVAGFLAGQLILWILASLLELGPLPGAVAGAAAAFVFCTTTA